MSTPIDTYIEEHRERFLEELKELLSIPSISTLPKNRPDVERASHFVASRLLEAGMEHVERIPTDGHPLVYAHWMRAPGKPTR